MSGGDYKSCDVCGCKTFYDAEVDYQDEVAPNYEQLPDRVGSWKVLCIQCTTTHKTVVVMVEEKAND